jgi:hypothetical protein
MRSSTVVIPVVCDPTFTVEKRKHWRKRMRRVSLKYVLRLIWLPMRPDSGGSRDRLPRDAGLHLDLGRDPSRGRKSRHYAKSNHILGRVSVHARPSHGGVNASWIATWYRNIGARRLYHAAIRPLNSATEVTMATGAPFNVYETPLKPSASVGGVLC